MDTTLQDFTNAIILQTVKDYRWARRKLRKDPNHIRALKTRAEVERFFRSDWYRYLTRLDHRRLLALLEKEEAQ